MDSSPTKLEFDEDTIQNPEFSYRAAFQLAHASQVAYEDDPKKVKNAFNEAVTGDIKILPFDRSSTEGILIETNHSLVIVFRGTKGKSDWGYNFKTDQVKSWFKYPGHIHEGFYLSLNHVWNEILVPAITGAATKGKKIVLTGHSLGGALCTLTAARIAVRRPDLVSGIYTFGQPKVGDQDFANYMDDHYYDRFHRFVFNRDIVPRIPPRGYWHCGRLFHFDHEGNLKEDLGFESLAGDDQLSDDEYERFQNEVLTHDVQDHISEPHETEYEVFPGALRALGIEDHHLVEKYIPAIHANISEV